MRLCKCAGSSESWVTYQNHMFWLIHVCLIVIEIFVFIFIQAYTRDVFNVQSEVDLMETAKVNAYIMHIFGKIELLIVHAT